MKKTLLLLPSFVLSCFSAHCQESFGKRYELKEYFLMKGNERTSIHADSTITKRELYTPIKDIVPGTTETFVTGTRKITLPKGSYTNNGSQLVLAKGTIIELEHVIVVKTEKSVPFTSLADSDKEKALLENKYVLGSTVSVSSEELFSNGKTTVARTVQVDKAFRNSLKVKKEVFNDSLGKVINDRYGYVKFEEDKLWVNPNLDGDFTNHGLFYYSLSNRQTVKLPFTEWSVSAMTLPLKYRPASKEAKGISQEFTSSVNLNAFIGYTYSGLTKFHYREKVGNLTTTRRWICGAVLGASTVTLDKNNTSATEKKITDDVKISKGVATVGLGVVYTYNKINFGGFTGVDYALGNAIAQWNYSGRPWFGLAVGYSLFSFKE